MKKESGSPGVFRSAQQLFSFLKRTHIRRADLVASISLSAAVGFLSVAELRLMLLFLHGIINREFTFLSQLSFSGAFVVVAALLFCVSLCASGMQYASSICMQRQMQTAEAHLRSRIFQRFLRFGKLYFDRQGFTDLQSVLMQHTRAVTKQLEALHEMSAKGFLLVSYAVFLSFLSWKLTVFSCLLFAGVTLLYRAASHTLRQLSSAEGKSRRQLDAKIFHILSCIPLVQSYAQEQKEEKYFRDVSVQEVEASYAIAKRTQLARQIQDLSSLCGLLLVAGAMAYVFPADGVVAASHYILFLLVMRMMIPCFAAVGEFSLQLARFSHALGRVQDVLENDKGKCIVPEGPKIFTGLRKGIEFRTVSFAYTKDNPVLSDISFAVEKGKKTAIIGATGSGKTTLIHLLLRFYDCASNSIFVDGEDIRNFTHASLRRHMALVSQDIFLFNDTLRNNIAYGVQDVTDDHLFAATRKAHLHDFIAKLPDQYDTVIGDRGIQMSGGEKQRTSISRAFLKSADILILDEASSSLDVRTESLVHQAINDVTADKTVIIIAHRLSTIKNADHIVVLDDGRVAEQGSFVELVAHRGLFHEYWQEQRLDDVIPQPMARVVG